MNLLAVDVRHTRRRTTFYDGLSTRGGLALDFFPERNAGSLYPARSKPSSLPGILRESTGHTEP